MNTFYNKKNLKRYLRKKNNLHGNLSAMSVKESTKLTVNK